MFTTSWFTATLLFSSTYALGQATKDTAIACAALKENLKLENTTITAADHVNAGSTVNTPGTCQSSARVSTSLCRVQFVIKTSGTSAVHAEMWLPDLWYGRFLALGNGGLGGCVDYANLDYGSTAHFAAVASDNGHDGNGGAAFLNKPEVINDFAFRAIHVETIIGKQILQAYYGRPQGKSYYLGCSTGGRQGTKAALAFPGDFDGIVAGAPATDFNHLTSWGGFLSKYTGPTNAASFIPAELWSVVATEVLRQCDLLDGVKDGIITEPDQCNFNPDVLRCVGGKNSGCLTAPQVGALRNIYSPLKAAGQVIYPRYDPGAEADGNSQVYFSGPLSPYTSDWFKFAVYNNSEYNFANFGQKDVAIADAINPGGISTFDGNLSAFRTRGGKFLTYHGRRDQVIASGNSKRVYNLISNTLRLPSLDSFYRLFLVPGMNHCAGGPGATNFGQVGIASNAVNASSHNVLLAMVDWVERGLAPDTIIGTSAAGAQRTHCRYPQKSMWNGQTFVCTM